MRRVITKIATKLYIRILKWNYRALDEALKGIGQNAGCSRCGQTTIRVIDDLEKIHLNKGT
jgi:hypothetical protein